MQVFRQVCALVSRGKLGDSITIGVNRRAARKTETCRCRARTRAGINAALEVTINRWLALQNLLSRLRAGLGIFNRTSRGCHCVWALYGENFMHTDARFALQIAI